MQWGMNDDATISTRRQPMMLRDSLLVLVAMALFLFALQPREHLHGSRRRDVDEVSDVETTRVPNHRQRDEAEALEDAVVRPAFDASL
jgi:hypothetical protein